MALKSVLWRIIRGLHEKAEHSRRPPVDEKSVHRGCSVCVCISIEVTEPVPAPVAADRRALTGLGAPARPARQKMVASELVLDRQVRDWVLLPLTFSVVLMMLLRQYATKASQPPCSVACI